jgi:hypothetical protein
MGDIELTASQVTCGKALLNKVLPDLQSTTMDANVGMTVIIAKEASAL